MGNLTEKAYQTIKDRIVHYQLKPGETLRFSELAEQLEMSQTPVREALAKLDREGLVRRESSRGYVVSSFDLNEIDELYDFRLVLEVEAARRVAEGTEAVVLDRLSRIIEQVGGVIQTGKKEDSLPLEQQFHALILEASRNRFLYLTGQGVLERIWMIQNFNILTSDRLIDAHLHHQDILNAFRDKDPELAGTLMHQHIKQAKEHIMARLRNSHDILGTLVGIRRPPPS